MTIPGGDYLNQYEKDNSGPAFFGMMFTYGSSQILPANDVPALVKQGFDAQYPHAKNVTWTHANEGYEVAFETSHSKYFVTYSSTGSARIQTIEIHKVKLPHGIRKKIEKNYSGFIVENSSRIDSGNGSVYVAEIGGSEEGFKLQFTAEGNLIKAESIDEPLAPK